FLTSLGTLLARSQGRNRMHTLLWLLWIPFAATTAWIIAGLAAVAALTRRPHQLSDRSPPVSVLKPLCGSDPGLRQNLESFFRQDHPDFELVFVVVDARDLALEVVRELAREFPAVRCRIVIHAGRGALNPKIDNLLGMLPRAEHDLAL